MKKCSDNLVSKSLQIDEIKTQKAVDSAKTVYVYPSKCRLTIHT